MPLVTAHHIRQNFKNNECQNFIVYGPLGVGKTSYSLQVLMEIYEKDIERDGLIQTLSQYFFHTPSEMLRTLRKFPTRIPAIAGDDLGVHLYALDFQKPLVKSMTKMFQMIRTRTSSVIMTTPTPTLILGKLRCFPQTVTIKIKKNSGWEQHGRPLRDLRTARAYRSWLLPDLQKLRIKKLYEDVFGVYLDRELYEWCCKKREIYVKLLEEEIERNLPKHLREGELLKGAVV